MAPIKRKAESELAMATAAKRRFSYEFEISPALWRQLRDTRTELPRYLFRAYCKKSGGGFPGLNTAKRIVPKAFLEGIGHSRMYQIPNLSEMLNTHLRWIPRGSTEFSSWAASILLVIGMAHEKYQDDPDAAIAVIDTTLVPHNAIFHVPTLHDVGLAAGSYPHEYLIHGVVEGDGYLQVPFKDLVEAGLYNFLPETHLLFNWGRPMRASFFSIAAPVRSIHHMKRPIEPEHCADLARQIGECFDHRFAERNNTGRGKHSRVTIWVTAALLSIRKRSWFTEGECEIVDIEKVVNALDMPPACDIPEVFLGEKSILKNCVYTRGYPEIRQMVHLLRWLSQIGCGKGARSRNRWRRAQDGSVEEAM